MRFAPRLTVLAVTTGGLMLLGMASASATTLGGQTAHIPIPGCATTVTSPSVTFTYNPTTANGTTGGATSTCT